MALVDVIGADEAKRLLREAYMLPTLFAPDTFKSAIRRVPSTILLHGPPGTGKTLLAQSLASESKARLVCLSPASLLSKWTGESEKALRAAFAQAAAPADGTCGSANRRGRDEASRRDDDQHAQTQLTRPRRQGRSRSRSSSCEEPRPSARSGTDGYGSGRYRSGRGRSTAGDDDDGRGGYAGSRSRSYGYGGAGLGSVSAGDAYGRPQSRSGASARPDTAGTHRTQGTDASAGRVDAHDGPVPAADRPGILFIDEIDALAPRRDGAMGGADLGARRLLTELLVLMSEYGADSQGWGSAGHRPRATRRLLVIAATNRPEDLDPALLRRFDRRVYVGLPGLRDRVALLTSLLRDVDHALGHEDLLDIAHATEGWNCADIKAVTSEAALIPVREAAEAYQQNGPPGQDGGAAGSSGAHDDDDDHNMLAQDDACEVSSIQGAGQDEGQQQEPDDGLPGHQVQGGEAPSDGPAVVVLMSPARGGDGAGGMHDGPGPEAGHEALHGMHAGHREPSHEVERPGTTASASSALQDHDHDDAHGQDHGLLTVRPVTMSDFQAALATYTPSHVYGSSAADGGQAHGRGDGPRDAEVSGASLGSHSGYDQDQDHTTGQGMEEDVDDCTSCSSGQARGPWMPALALPSHSSSAMGHGPGPGPMVPWSAVQMMMGQLGSMLQAMAGASSYQWPGEGMQPGAGFGQHPLTLPAGMQGYGPGMPIQGAGAGPGPMTWPTEPAMPMPMPSPIAMAPGLGVGMGMGQSFAHHNSSVLTAIPPRRPSTAPPSTNRSSRPGASSPGSGQGMELGEGEGAGGAGPYDGRGGGMQVGQGMRQPSFASSSSSSPTQSHGHGTQARHPTTGEAPLVLSVGGVLFGVDHSGAGVEHAHHTAGPTTRTWTAAPQDTSTSDADDDEDQEHDGHVQQGQDDVAAAAAEAVRIEQETKAQLKALTAIMGKGLPGPGAATRPAARPTPGAVKPAVAKAGMTTVTKPAVSTKADPAPAPITDARPLATRSQAAPAVAGAQGRGAAPGPGRPKAAASAGTAAASASTTAKPTGRRL